MMKKSQFLPACSKTAQVKNGEENNRTSVTTYAFVRWTVNLHKVLLKLSVFSFTTVVWLVNIFEEVEDEFWMPL